MQRHADNRGLFEKYISVRRRWNVRRETNVPGKGNESITG